MTMVEFARERTNRDGWLGFFAGFFAPLRMTAKTITKGVMAGGRLFLPPIAWCAMGGATGG